MRLILDFKEGSLAGQKRELFSNIVKVGRGPNCDLKFDINIDKTVSTNHAVFSKDENGYFYLEDQNSTNGTFVNGARISKIRLQAGDVIHFGSLKGPKAIVNIEMPAPPAEISQPTVFVRTPSPSPSNAPTLVDSAHFVPLSYFESGHEFSLPKPPQVTKLKESLATVGLYNPDIYAEKPPTSQNIGVAVAIVVALILALIIIALTLYQLGPLVAIIATLVAFIPACFYILPLIWLDRYDPEPAWLLACAFGWGALVSIVGTFAVSIMAMVFLHLSFGRMAAAIFDLPFISAPIVEEGMKGLGLVVLLLLFRKHFDGIVDGIVYGGVIALGFATVENVLYYGDNLAQFGPLGLALNFVMRGILSPFAHVTFTAMTGIGCGLSRESYKWPVRIFLPMVGYLAAVMLHAIWNFIASVFVAYYGIWGFLGGYAIVEFPFFILFVCFVGYTFFREKNILKKHLYVSMVKGVITQEQIDTVTSVFKGLKWLIEGMSNGKFMARHKFMRAVSKLGLAWWHVERAKTEQGETRSFGLIPALERDVLHWRNQI